MGWGEEREKERGRGKEAFEPGTEDIIGMVHLSSTILTIY
jgi:hypothetical protein